MMRAAHDAGLRVIPMGANKQPAIPWKGRGMAELDELIHWARSDYDGYAILCGGEQRLVVFDFEGGFDFLGFVELLRDVDLYDLFYGWLEAYKVGTPGEGLHVAVFLGGDGPVPGNTKLSFDEEGKTTAETRGEGGLVVGPGSGGRVHPTGRHWMLAPGGGFEQICLVTPEEYRAVCEVVVKMSAATPPSPVPPVSPPAAGVTVAPGAVSLAQLERSSSYLEVAKAAMPSMWGVLEPYGWQVHHRDADYVYLTRPGKDPREGVSATINASDRLFVFSSNAHPVPASPGRQTYSVIDVLAFYQGVDGGDIVRQYRPAYVPREAPAVSASDLVLPDWFWEATPILEHIRRAAWSRRISPDTLYEAVKCMYAASIPWNFRLPEEGTFDYLSLMVGNSGSGKTRSKKAAMALMPPELLELDGVRLSMPAPSSGEGIVESYIRREKGKQVGLRYRGLNFYIDEGQQFFSVLDRSGNTLVEVLKSAWPGEMTGNTAAMQDRHRVLTPGEVRVTVLIGIQLDVAAQFLTATHTNGGLPQRAIWSWPYHSNRVPPEPVAWPGPLPVTLYDRNAWGGGDSQHIIHELTYETTVNQEVRARQDARADDPDTELLDAQAEYAILKTAGILALMHGEMEITPHWWNLATTNWDTSCAVRDEVERRNKNAITDRDIALGRAQAARNLATVDVYLERAINSLVKKVNANDGPLLAVEAKNHLSSYRKRYKLAYTEIVDAAIHRGKLVIHSSGGLTPP